MTLAHAPDRSDPPQGSGPDSTSLRVSLKTSHESGIPPARDRLARSSDANAALDQLELVLVESTRAEANLGLLLRGLKHLAAGAGAAQEANAILMQELELLRSRLGKVYERESLLQQRVHTLENALTAAAHERESWLVQEDAFLVSLLDDHEQKVFELEREHERRLAELDLAFDELRRQHDMARTDVVRLSYERDAAVALLSEPMPITERTPPALTSSPTSAPPPPELRLPSVKLAKPVLRPKPDQPLGGYHMTSSDIEEDLDRSVTERPPSF